MLGAGALLGGKYALTCAHVRPGREVLVDLIGVGGRAPALEYVADRDRLAELLNRLEQVRRTLQDDQDRRYDWVTVSCGR
ncbi:hypothetical protein [Crossiella sp. CA198]|uniref:hypothetical protein n=1 Tax=Crossiella sp. CA198 TaxID=3455607 RepID=UPI003F8D63C4